MYKSLICPINDKEKDIARALKEVDDFSNYLKLDDNVTGHIRLLSEELLEMIDSVLDVEDGRFYIESEDGITFKIHLAVEAIVGDSAEKVLVKVSSSKENTAYKGVKGLLRQVMDFFGNAKYGSLPTIPDNAVGTGLYAGLTMQEDFCEWSINQYLEEMKRDEKVENWDELEMSVLTKIAKDIKVNARREGVSIVITY